MAGPLRSFTVNASGIVLPELATHNPQTAGPGRGGLLSSIYGVVTTGGTLVVYDGIDDSTTPVLTLPLAVGAVAIDPDGYWRCTSGVYVAFTASLAGTLVLNFQ